MMDRATIQEIKEREDLNYTINHLSIIIILRTHHPTIIEYTFFLSALETLDHTLAHKTNFPKFKKMEIIQNVFSDHME